MMSNGHWLTRSLILCASLVGCGGTQSTEATTAEIAPSAAHEARTPGDWQSDRYDPLASRMADSARHLVTRGWQPASAQQRGFIVVGTAVTVPVEVPAQTCVAWIGLGSPGIRDLDATLFSPDGDAVAEDVEEDAHPTVAACAEGEARTYYMVLRAYAGAGAYLIGSFQGSQDSLPGLAAALGGKPGIASSSAPELAVDARVRTFGEGMSRRGFRNMHDTYRIPVRANTPVQSALSMEAGHCYTVAVFAEDNVEDAQVRLLDEATHVLASDESGSFDAAAQVCVTQTQAASIEVRSVRGDGAVLVAVWDGTAADVGGAGGLWLGVRP